MTSDPAASTVPTADANEVAAAGGVVSAGFTPPPRRLAVYRLGEEPKSMVARLTLKPNDEGQDHVQIESDSEEYGSKVREIIKQSAGEERDQATDPAHRAEKQRRVWTRITDNLSAEAMASKIFQQGTTSLHSRSICSPPKRIAQFRRFERSACQKNRRSRGGCIPADSE